MALIIKLLLLQAYWFICVLYGPHYESLVFGLSFLFPILNFLLNKSFLNLGKTIFLILIFLGCGLLIDFIPFKLGLVSYPQEGMQLWLASMYVIFVCYYGDVFNKFQRLNGFILFFIGAVGGTMAYYSGGKLAGLEYHNFTQYWLYISVAWGVFFLFSIKVYYEDLMWGRVLDASIVYSFDKRGYERHSKRFKVEEFKTDGDFLVTGGTSGIGLSCAKDLIEAGGRVFVTGRNENKGKEAEEKHSVFFLKLDMGDWKSIKGFVERIEKPLTGLVLNAGGMPHKFETNEFGVESQVASQFFGHYFLLKELYTQNKLTEGARVVFVSSGGMYLKNLDLSILFENPQYDKVATYANVKRMQLMSLKFLINEFPKIDVIGMHPGWVDTPGLREAISDFFDKMKDVLRSPKQGSDTIVWSLLTKEKIVSGGFYFDRKKVSIHYFPHTLLSIFKQKQLENEFQKICDLFYKAF